MLAFEKFQAGLSYADFLDRYATDVQEQRWREAHARFARARIRDFVPVFVEREVRRQLAAQAD